MRLPLLVTLVLGSLSLLLAGGAAFMCYLEWIGQPTQHAIAQLPLDIASSVGSATDLATLKAVCLSLAQSHDSIASVQATQLAWFKSALSGIGSFFLAWGLISGVAMLYLHFLLRRLAREGRAYGL